MRELPQEAAVQEWGCRALVALCKFGDVAGLGRRQRAAAAAGSRSARGARPQHRTSRATGSAAGTAVRTPAAGTQAARAVQGAAWCLGSTGVAGAQGSLESPGPY